MTRILIITVAFGMLLFTSCSSNQEENKTEEVTVSESVSTPYELVLNDGEKWKVVDDMMIHIENMQTDFNSFNETEENAYHSLGVKLEENIDLLTSNCTMTGQAHDELHKWLVPYIGLAGDLTDAKNDEESVNAHKAIETSFEVFDIYFE